MAAGARATRVWFSKPQVVMRIVRARLFARFASAMMPKGQRAWPHGVKEVPPVPPPGQASLFAGGQFADQPHNALPVYPQIVRPKILPKLLLEGAAHQLSFHNSHARSHTGTWPAVHRSQLPSPASPVLRVHDKQKQHHCPS